MKLAGFNYTKIAAEKFKSNFKDLKIETSINLETIEEAKADLLKTNDLFLGIKFKYIINYNPEIAKLEFGGNMLISIDSKKGKEILKDWKDKKLKEEMRLSLFNGILRKTTLKAAQIEEELGLPLHFKLPSLQSPKESK